MQPYTCTKRHNNNTVEPLNKGQVGSTTLVRCREVVPFSEVVFFSSTQKSFDSIIKRVWLPVCRTPHNIEWVWLLVRKGVASGLSVIWR